MSVTQDEQSFATGVHSQRYFLCIAAAVYLAWWFVVEALLKGSFNPLPSRLAISGLFVLVLAASFASAFVRRHLRVFYDFAVSALTLHYYYLFFHNPGQHDWIVGAYITVLAVGATLSGVRVTLAYSVLVLVATYVVTSHDPSSTVVLPGLVTALVVINMVALLREKADKEKARRVTAEAEKAVSEATSRAKSQFLANMSHELRTPLTSIVGFADLISVSEALSPDGELMLERLRAQSGILLDLVEQVLSLTEEDFTRDNTPYEAIDIHQVIHASVEKVRPACLAKGLKLSEAVEQPLTDTIFGDAPRIQRIVDNVLGNAVKFSNSGAIHIAADQRPGRLNDELKLTLAVKDSGIGIDKADWDKVFEPFRQVHGGLNRPFDGAGVGLSIARKFARAMGGDVTIAASALGEGTTVCVSLLVRTSPPSPRSF